MTTMYTRGDPNAPDDRGPSMMQRHAEARAREAAHATDAYLRREFPNATDATLALALEKHDGDAQLAKDALREFFDAERAGRTTTTTMTGGAGSSGRERRRRRRREGSSSSSPSDDDGSDDDGSRSGRRRHKKHRKSSDRRKHKKHKKSSRRSRSRSASRGDEGKKPERRAFGDDEAERRRELAEAREKEAAAKQHAILARMRAQGGGAARDGMREQELLRSQLQIAHRQGDVHEVERLQNLLAKDDALDRAAKDNYGFRANA